MAISSIVTFSSTSVFAQENNSPQDTMVVVSSMTPRAISDIPASVLYIDNEQITQQYRAGKSLADILSASIPGLDVATGGRSNYGQNLRGRSMLVMIDGVSMQSSRPISRQLDSIDPFNIQGIEVLSGATSIYGAGATGGVINIITKKADSPKLQLESYASTTSGFNASNDFDYKVAQSISGGNDKVLNRTSVVYTKTQGFYDADGTIVTPDITQGSNQFNQTIDLQSHFTFNLDDSRNVDFLAQYYDSQQDSPYGLYIVNGNFVDVRDGFESDRQQGTERIMLNAVYSDPFVWGGQQFIGQASFRRENQTFSPYYQAASQQITNVYALKGVLSKTINKWNFVYGLDSYLDQFTSNSDLFDPTIADNSGNMINKTYANVGRYPGVDVSSIAAFLQTEYKITDKWLVQGGYRFQYMYNKIDDFVSYATQKQIAEGNGTSADAVPGGNTDYWIGLFNIGTIYKLTPSSQVWANFSQGFDLPDPAKYYGQGNYTLNGNHWDLDSSINVNSSKLSGIKTNSYEVGYRTDTDSTSFQSSLYYSYSDKSVKYDKNTLNIVSVEDPIQIYGLESKLSYWLLDNVQVGVSGNYVVSKEKSNGSWVNMSADTASASNSSSWVSWYNKDLMLKLQSQTMYDYKDDNGNELNGYTTFDLLGGYQLPVGSLGFGIQNLFNKEYTTVWGQRAQILYSSQYSAAAYDYKGRGRTFTLNYQVKY
ncbi:TonB-dependent receptor [Vibrio sp. S4M6]|nr:TonB-dependent receptor [Vibrio sinus]